MGERGVTNTGNKSRPRVLGNPPQSIVGGMDDGLD